MIHGLMHSQIGLQTVGFGLFVICLLSGCSGREGYDVSGNVTFDGKPLPAGKIYFSPDGAKGNSGATGYATITDGKYNTAAADGRPVVGGAMTVRIDGWNPAAAGQKAKGDTSGEVTVESLFPTYETTADLGQATGTQDFAVPAEAAKRRDAPESGVHTGP
jgi:hypothetical protein